MVDEADPQQAEDSPEGPDLVNIYDLKAEGEEDPCLRQIGYCEFGGCCEVCTYGPNGVHVKNRKQKKAT